MIKKTTYERMFNLSEEEKGHENTYQKENRKEQVWSELGHPQIKLELCSTLIDICCKD